MDLLKSCTTNVQAIPELGKTRAFLYTRAHNDGGIHHSYTQAHNVESSAEDTRQSHPRARSAGSLAAGIHDIVADLRQKGISCTASPQHIWLFCSPGADAVPSLEGSSWKLELEGALEELEGTLQESEGTSEQLEDTSEQPKGTSEQLEGTVPGKAATSSKPSIPPPNGSRYSLPAQEELLKAVQGGLSFSLARQHGAVRLGSWTWLLPPKGSGADSLVLRVRTRVATPATLYLTTSLDDIMLASLDLENIRDGTTVVLAPGAIPATLRTEASQGPDNSDPIGRRRSDADRWKAAVKTALSAEGVVLHEDTEWVEVLPIGTHSSILWPAHLCFYDTSLNTKPLAKNMHDHWKQYFTSTHTPAYTDPLALAESWFTTTAERDRAIAEPAEASLPIIADVHMASHYSPLVRHDLPSLHGIYPTPPDGLVVTAHPPQQIISSDHVDSAPTEPPNLVKAQAQIQLQQEAVDESPLMQPDADQTDDSRRRIPSIESSVGADKAYQGRQEDDDLFGDDMEGMEFEGDEVGDADFNFFDEPDEAPGAEGLQLIEAGETVPPGEIQAERDVNDHGGGHATAQQDCPDESHVADYDIDLRQPDMPTAQTKAVETAPETPEISGPSVQETRVTNTKQEQRPLSPFGIREQLLPPPIPASAASHAPTGEIGARRGSIFGPLAFKQGLDLDFTSKYGLTAFNPGESPAPGIIRPTMTFSATRGKRKRNDDFDDSDASSTSMDAITDSEDDDDEEVSIDVVEGLDEAASSVQDSRDVHSGLEYTPVRPPTCSRNITGYGQAQDSGLEDIQYKLRLLLDASVPADVGQVLKSERLTVANDTSVASQSLLNGHKLSPKDLITVAQLISEQAVSATSSIVQELDRLRLDAANPPNEYSTSASESVTSSLSQMFPATKTCDLSAIALPREVLNRPPANVSKGQPRLPPRPEAAATGPDVSAIPAPFVRVQRGDNDYELLPTALSFWEALSLGPVSGPKDIKAYCVVPENQDLEDAAELFLESLKSAYEGGRLGSHSRPSVREGAAESDTGSETFATVSIDSDCSLSDTLQEYTRVCQELGEQLASTAFDDPTRTIVVYIVNPFPANLTQAIHHLCAAFYALYTTYRSNLSPSPSKPNDLVLQLLPIDLVASPHALVLPTASEMAILAREVYDRCPPSASAQEATSPLPIPAVPAVELASPLPKRINFQPAAEPPRDLLNDGSVLHLAYALSTDKQWILASWTDFTGRYQNSTVFSLRGQSFADAAEEIWSRTLDVLAARECSWRVFISTAEAVDKAISACWRDVVQRLTARKQVVSVSLLRFQPEINLHISTLYSGAITAVDVLAASQAASGGFLTPVSTPQTTGFGLSPEGAGHGPGTAPPTPAPSDIAAAVESDPEAHLVDVADETWSVLLDHKIGSTLISPWHPKSFDSVVETPPALAYAALFKRGAAEAEVLPAVGTSLVWTVRVRANSGGVDEGGQRHAEVLLREVLGMWRGLGVLAKTRGLGEGLVPVHLLVAAKGVEGLVGMVEG